MTLAKMRNDKWFKLCKCVFGCVCETMTIIVMFPQTTLVPREDHIQGAKGHRGRPGQDSGKAVLLNLDLDLARLCNLDLDLDLDAEIQSCSCLIGMVFTRSKQDFATRFTMNNKYLERLNVTKILGVWISENLSWAKNTQEILKKGYSRVSFLSKLKYAGVETSWNYISFSLEVVQNTVQQLSTVV